jgi:hypothetical protein
MRQERIAASLASMDGAPRPDDGMRGEEAVPPGPGVSPSPGEPARVDLDPALVEYAHPTEAERIRRGAVLGSAFGALLLVLARRRRARR